MEAVALAGRLPWICVVILVFPLLVPGSPRQVLIGSLLAASMDRFGLLIARARGLELPPTALLAWTYLPSAGLVHRDIKPANLHLGRVGLEYDFVKVLDFGLVKRQTGLPEGNVELTSPEAVSGTPAYMAPEMASGEPVDGRSDLYGLGCVGYFLLTGERPFQDDHPMQLILHHIRSEPVPPSVRLGRPVPAGLERLLMRCLAKNPADRPGEAAALAEALCTAGADEWTQSDARGWWETTFSPAPRREERPEPLTAVLDVAAAGEEAIG